MRKTFAIGIFYIYMTAGAVLLEVVGVTAAWGVESPTGVTSSIAETRAKFSEINASGGLEDTLFGSFSAAADLIEDDEPALADELRVFRGKLIDALDGGGGES